MTEKDIKLKKKAMEEYYRRLRLTNEFVLPGICIFCGIVMMFLVPMCFKVSGKERWLVIGLILFALALIPVVLLLRSLLLKTVEKREKEIDELIKELDEKKQAVETLNKQCPNVVVPAINIGRQEELLKILEERKNNIKENEEVNTNHEEINNEK